MQALRDELQAATAERDASEEQAAEAAEAATAAEAEATKVAEAQATDEAMRQQEWVVQQELVAMQQELVEAKRKRQQQTAENMAWQRMEAEQLESLRAEVSAAAATKHLAAQMQQAAGLDHA